MGFLWTYLAELTYILIITRCVHLIQSVEDCVSVGLVDTTGTNSPLFVVLVHVNVPHTLVHARVIVLQIGQFPREKTENFIISFYSVTGIVIPINYSA